MKSRSTLILFISILLLGAFIWVQETVRAKNSGKKMEQVRLFNLDVTTLISIEFRYTNSVVQCRKENGVWMAGDRDGNMGRADVALIQRMVSGLNSMGKGTTITSKNLEIRGFDSSEYGFAQPTIEITAVDNQGGHNWMVGRETPLGDMVYAKNIESDEIYTISDKLLIIAPSSHDHLRDRVLFPGESVGVRRIEIRGSAGFVQLLKDPQSDWTIQQPVAAKADQQEVEGFLENLYGFRVENFIADNVSDFSVYGLQEAAHQISMESGDGASRMLVVGDAVPDRSGFVYARRADDTSVFTLSSDVLQLLNLPAERFREARVLPLPLAEISSIQILKGDEQVLLELDDSNQWNLSSPVVWEADRKSIADLIILWGSAVITEFNIVTNNLPLEWTFEFASKETATINRIDVFSSNGKMDGLLIRRDDDPTFYQINLPVMPPDLIDPLRYKSRQIWQLDQAGINKITLVKEDQSSQVIERQEDQSFALTGAHGNLELNEEACAQLLQQLELVETAEYITYNPRDLEIYGLTNPAFELQVGLSNSNKLGRVLLIGRETPKGFYSMIKGRDVVFYLDKLLVNNLSANLVSEQVSPVLLSE